MVHERTLRSEVEVEILKPRLRHAGEIGLANQELAGSTRKTQMTRHLKSEEKLVKRAKVAQEVCQPSRPLLLTVSEAELCRGREGCMWMSAAARLRK